MSDKAKEPQKNICCVCGGTVTLYTKNECSITAPWGRFVLQYHKACETPETKKNIAERVRQIAIENKP